MEQAEAAAELSADSLEKLQLEKLQKFIAYAYTNSPYYARKYDLAGVSPADLSCLGDLKKFPILEKEELRQFTSEIQCRNAVGQKDLQWISTSGTTGSPITIAFTPADMQQRFAYLYRMLRQFEIEPFDTSVRFSGRAIYDGAEKNNIFWRMNWPQNQMLMSSYHLKNENLDHYVRRLIEFQPKMMDGYPSSIFILARHINNTGQHGAIKPKLIMTTAETLEDFQRAEIISAFPDVKIANQYASSEGAPFITEDIYGDLIINTDTGVIEAGGDACDESGEMIVTSFTTHAFPLIRYRIGDRIAMKPGQLGRSMAMPVAKGILGRQEDLIISPDRGPVGRLDPVFKKMPSTVVESQIEQTAPSHVVLRAVPDYQSGYAEEQLDSVVAELQKRLGAMTIKIETVDALPRGKNGKLRAVIGRSMDKL
ncbi:MAG: hypothetical protein V3V15_03025 [Sphingorhabdus sp.]